MTNRIFGAPTGNSTTPDAIATPSDIEAYRLGLAASRQGMTGEACPYPLTHGSRTSWWTGWYEGRHEAMFGWPPRWE